MLDPWQIRMVQDFTGMKFRHLGVIVVKPGVITCPASYKIPPEGISKHDWVLYLNNEQIKMVRKYYKIKDRISGINITAELIKKGDVAFRDNILKLKLEKWQARMAMDNIERKRSPKYMLVRSDVIKCPASYKIPVEGLSRKDWLMYLTSEQMDLFQEAFGLKEPISSLNITDTHIDNKEVVFM